MTSGRYTVLSGFAICQKQWWHWDFWVISCCHFFQFTDLRHKKKNLPHYIGQNYLGLRPCHRPALTTSVSHDHPSAAHPGQIAPCTWWHDQCHSMTSGNLCLRKNELSVCAVLCEKFKRYVCCHISANHSPINRPNTWHFCVLVRILWIAFVSLSISNKYYCNCKW